MNRSLYIIILILLTVNAKAQINELGLFAGGSNYIGDIGPTDYISPNEPAIGIIYKWNRSPRHSWRASFTYANIASDDADSEISGRSQRGFSFESTIKELSVGMEFSWFEFNLHESGFKLTPYVYSGISHIWYDDLYYNFATGASEKNDKSKTALAIPMVIGLKSHIARDWIIGFEVGARYTFTDNLDGSNPEGDNEVLSFGNRESKDWYVFTGLTISYTFTDKPCYCAE
jgi:hypothetical protein